MIASTGRIAIAALMLTALAACSTGPSYSPGPMPPSQPSRPSGPPGPSRPQPDTDAFDTSLRICRGMTVSNAPPADEAGRVIDFNPFIRVGGVPLAVNPAPGACLSSGVGPRNDRLHKGTDYHSPEAPPILAAGSGTVVELTRRDDYGNMIVINHGGGVYTRYAHLLGFSPDMEVGREVAMGQQIGLMGNTAAYSIPVHLHYEILTGNYDTPKKSFGLTPVDPFAELRP